MLFPRPLDRGVVMRSLWLGVFCMNSSYGKVSFYQLLLKAYMWGLSHTWIHPNAATARLDYLAIPLRWTTARWRTWTDFGLQAHQHLHDHLATCMQITAALGGDPELIRTRRAPPKEKLDAWGPMLMQQAVDTMGPMCINARAF